VLNQTIRNNKDCWLGYERIDAYNLNPKKCREIAIKLIKGRPAGLIGYSSALDYFVRVTEEFHSNFRVLGLKFIMPAGEMAPKPDTFELLSKIFNCPIVQELGGVEYGQLAMKFGDEPFRTFNDLNFVESIGSESLAENHSESLVLTSLYKRYIPLIRYRQGDEVTGIKKLANGHIFSFDEIIGRTHDMIELPNGDRVHSMAVLHAIHEEKEILAIQLVLRNTGPFIRLAVIRKPNERVILRIRGRLNKISNQLTNIPIEFVEDISTNIAGKRRWLVDERSK
jgi:phenylacetate-coenzyme A ligase PaaK-like adenylate-forming protein